MTSKKAKNDSFIIPTTKEPKKTSKRFDVLLKLSELRKEQVLTGDKIKELREELLIKNAKLKELSESIYNLLDDLE
jgi:hypothetical protein